jgi:alkanesulfonate monooxygenase SsuD/methylene tetrahydromethanopterin reductase-like flavin-dependent oxidoreductase (luciferase family)
MAIAARYASVWNAWTMPDDLADCNATLNAHCETIGRDPAEISRSTQALVFLSRDEAWLAPHRELTGRPVIVGTPEEVVDIVGRYRVAGCDELIIPGWTLGDTAQTLETVELFSAEVARHFPD